MYFSPRRDRRRSCRLHAEAGRRRLARRFPADFEALHQLAVHADVELLRPPHAHDVVLILPAQTNLYEIRAVGGKIIVNRDAAARAERQILALPVVLDATCKANIEEVSTAGFAGGRPVARRA